MIMFNALMSPQEYLHQITGKWYIGEALDNVCETIEYWLSQNGYDGVKHYPFAQVDKIIDVSVILVDITRYCDNRLCVEYAWFEVPENAYCLQNKEKK